MFISRNGGVPTVHGASSVLELEREFSRMTVMNLVNGFMTDAQQAAALAQAYRELLYEELMARTGENKWAVIVLYNACCHAAELAEGHHSPLPA